MPDHATDRRKTAALAAEKLRVGKRTHVVRDFRAARELLRSSKVRQAGAGTAELDMTNPDGIGLFYLDGEPHRRKRAAIAKFFTLRAIETRYREIVERTTARLLDEFRAAGHGRLDEIGFRLAVAVASEIIGLDHGDLDGLAARIQATLTGPDDRLPVRPIGDPAVLAFRETDVQPAIDARRRERRDDVISQLIDDGWSDRAILTEVLGYSVAGMLTTRELIVMGAWYMCEQPDLRRRFVAADRDEQLAILDEVLRLEPIVAVVVRRVAEDVDTPACGQIAAGTLVAIDIRAANLDEAAAGACPHAVDPARAAASAAGSGFMSFGDGAHRCPGAQLALHEVRHFLDSFLAIPGVRMDQAPSLAWFAPVSGYELHDAIVSCDPVEPSTEPTPSHDRRKA